MTQPTLPVRGQGQRVPDEQINGVDQRNLTLDAAREVKVTLLSETSRSVDSLLVYEINDAGEMVDVRTVFAGMNTPGQVHFDDDNATPGTTVSLGVVPEGTELGFVLVNDGGRDYGSLFGSGRFELRSGEGPGTARITDSSPPVLVHIAPDGTETVVDERLYFTADDSQHTDNNNALNPDGLGHVVSGWDADQQRLVLGFEDGGRVLKHDPYNVGRDNDFDDAIVAVTYGEPVDGGKVVDLDMDLGASITDPDSARMSTGVVFLDQGLAGDRLNLPDGVLAGTGITATQTAPDRIVFDGAAPVGTYEEVMSAVNLVLDPKDPEPGPRIIKAQVTDDTGLVSNTAQTTIAITQEALGDGDGPGAGDGGGVPGDGDGDGGSAGGDGGGDCPPLTLMGTAEADSIIGRSPCDDTLIGREGDDYLRARSGDDTLDGGPGRDFLNGGPGRDLLIGGADDDVLHPGPGADTVRLGGGHDRIHGFNPAEGDRLDLEALFDDADPAVLDGAFKLHGKTLVFDADGPDGAAGRPVATFVDSPNVVDLASLGLEHPQAPSDGATA